MVGLEKNPPWIAEDIRFNQQYARDIGRRHPHNAPLRPLVCFSYAGRVALIKPIEHFPPASPSRSANPTPDFRDRRPQEDQGTIVPSDRSTASRPVCFRGSAHSPDDPMSTSECRHPSAGSGSSIDRLPASIPCPREDRARALWDQSAAPPYG